MYKNPSQRWVILINLLCAYLMQESNLILIHTEAVTSGFPGTISPNKKDHQMKSTKKKSTKPIASTSSSTQMEKKNDPTQPNLDEEGSSSSEYDLDSNRSLNPNLPGSTNGNNHNSKKKNSTPSSSSKKKSSTAIKNKNENANVNASNMGQQAPSASYQPLRTLKKLQAMLDETDYATSASNSKLQQDENQPPFEVIHPPISNVSPLQQDIPSPLLVADQEEDELDIEDAAEEITEDDLGDDGMDEFEIVGGFIDDDNDADNEEPQQLWTSRDRSKYRKQQRQLQQKRNHFQGSSSDDDGTTDDTDADGLGYTLPNLPVFFSDGEETESDGTSSMTQKQYSLHQNMQQPRFQQQQPTQQQQHQQHQQHQQQQQQQQQQQSQTQQQVPQQRGQAAPYQYQMPPGYGYNYPPPRPYQPVPTQYQNNAAHYNQNPYAPPYWYPPPQSQHQHQAQTQTQTGYPSYYYDPRRQAARSMVPSYEQRAFNKNSVKKENKQINEQRGLQPDSHASQDQSGMIRFDDSKVSLIFEPANETSRHFLNVCVHAITSSSIHRLFLWQKQEQ